MSKNSNDYTKNLSVEYYNYRNWQYNNQTRCESIEHGIHVPIKYLINLNIDNIAGANNGYCS